MVNKYFVVDFQNMKSNFTWCYDGQVCYRVGIPDAKIKEGLHFKVLTGSTVFSQLEEHISGSGKARIFEKEIAPGQYYNRIARPSDDHPFDVVSFPVTGIYLEEIASSVAQLTSLVHKLLEISQVVEPCEENLQVYGHKLRECILIAAMEVESHWKSVLVSNGYEDGRLNTNDYFKTMEPLKLHEYSIKFVKFPKLKKISPFREWKVSSPTQSLKFYNSYNKIKHDREKMFHLSTVDSAFGSFAAVVILAVSQFGWSNIFRRNSILSEFCEVIERPVWEPVDCYTRASNEWPAKAINHPFDK